MGRALSALAAVLVCAFFSAAVPTAQTNTSPDGWVVLPIDEYRSLRDRANPPLQPIAAPPVDATLTRIDYDLRVDADAIAGRALLTIDVLREGWTRLQIPAGLMVREASIDGQPLALVDGPPPQVLLSHSGRSLVTLDLVIPLAAAAGAESMALPPSTAPISRVRFRLPRSGVDLSITGGFIAEHSETANESRWTAFGHPNQALTMKWKRKVDDRRAEQPLRVRARVTQFVGLGEEVSQVTATIRVEVLQGLAREISVGIPAGLVVNQVNGSTVADWETTGGLLHVKLLEPAASEVSLVVSGDARTARDGTIAVPLVRMPSAERETGGVAVDVAGTGEIRERQTRGFEPADPAELGDLVAGRESPSMIAFRHRPLAGVDARTINVAVVRYTPQAVSIANVEEARYRALASEDGRLLVEARYAVRNNQRSFLKATLPAGSTIWSAQVGGRPIRPGVAETNAVLLPLEKGRANEEAPTFVVELLYLQRTDAWADKGRARIELPALDLPISRTGVELHYSPRFRVEPQLGSFRVDTDPGPFAAALRLPLAPPPPPAPPSPASASERGAEKGLQALVERFQNERGGRIVIGSLPVRVAFPSFGPSVFLAAELTAEAATPSVDLLVKRAK
jgi:hypothetical protein